jgi:hypothetical protein
MYAREWLHEFALVTRTYTLLGSYLQNSCILTTRVGLGVLERYGVKARAQAVTAVAFNREGWELASQNVPPSEWPDSAWAVGTEGTGKTDPETNAWDGHLVLVVRNPNRTRTLIDLTADQLDRPARGLPVPGPVFMDLPPVWTPDDPRFTFTGPSQEAIISYRPQAKAGNWQDTPDWVRDPGAVVDAICKDLGDTSPLAGSPVSVSGKLES